jgi:RNA polymerase sigma factor (sigma-70 family)
VEPNHEMYERLIEPIEERMIAIVTRIMQDHHDAMDVFQEVLAVVWKKLKTIDRHPNAQAYILRICVTRSYDALRKKVRYRQKIRRQEEIQQQRQNSAGNAGDLALTIRQAIALLPPKQAKTVFLRLIEGEDFAAIGAILACSSATARSHFSKGRTRLQQILRDAGICPERSSI